MRRVFQVLTCLVLAGARADAQSLNLDYGDAAGTPPPQYAGAGLPGVWNSLTAGPNVSQPLVDLTGQSTAATVHHDVTLPMGIDDPQTGGFDETLLDDGLPGIGDVAVTICFEGLLDGSYELTTYAWTPTVPADSTLIIVNDDYETGRVAGGPWPGGLQEPITHVRHHAQVADGFMTITVVGGYWGASGFLNGIQLVRIDPANFDPADLDQDGAVTFSDLLILISQWSTPGHGCNGIMQCIGDLNGDHMIDFSDLLILIGAWTG